MTVLFACLLPLNCVYVISGPSLSGKSTLMLKLKSRNYVQIKQYTTRPPRSNDTDYMFVDHADFLRISRNYELCATRWYYPHPTVNNTVWFYFYLCNDIQMDSVLITDVMGAKSLMTKFNCINICVYARRETMFNRLLKRGSSLEQIRRMYADSIAYSDRSHCNIYFNSESNRFICNRNFTHSLCNKVFI